MENKMVDEFSPKILYQLLLKTAILVASSYNRNRERLNMQCLWVINGWGWCGFVKSPKLHSCDLNWLPHWPQPLTTHNSAHPNILYSYNYFTIFSRMCKISKKGREYTGTVSQTSKGKTCQRWDSQSPQKHKYKKNANKFPDATLADAANYCRNPDGSSTGPWCYTTDPKKRWQYCDIPMCSKFSFWIRLANY